MCVWRAFVSACPGSRVPTAPKIGNALVLLYLALAVVFACKALVLASPALRALLVMLAWLSQALILAPITALMAVFVTWASVSVWRDVLVLIALSA